MDDRSFDNRLGAKLKAERALPQPRRKHKWAIAGLVISVAASGGAFALKTLMGN